MFVISCSLSRTSRNQSVGRAMPDMVGIAQPTDVTSTCFSYSAAWDLHSTTGLSEIIGASRKPIAGLRFVGKRRLNFVANQDTYY